MSNNLSDTTLHPTRETLASWALLYLADELDSQTRHRFESMLESDLIAQEQLALAVQLTSLVEDRSITPDPNYRSVVRNELSPPRVRSISSGYWITGVGLGLAASLLWIAFSNSSTESNQTVSLPLEQFMMISHEIASKQEATDTTTATAPDNSGMAETWAGITNLDQLSTTEDERRRVRTRDANPLIPSALIERGVATE